MSVPTAPEHEHSIGARPVGAANEADAAANVQQMFDTIAPQYDLLNHMLSGGSIAGGGGGRRESFVLFCKGRVR